MNAVDNRDFTGKVLTAYSHIEDPRLKSIVSLLIKHLHACVKEMKVSDEEWEFAWDFMERMAEKSSPSVPPSLTTMTLLLIKKPLSSFSV